METEGWEEEGEPTEFTALVWTCKVPVFVLKINFTIRREEEKETININTIMFIFREKISALIRSLSRVFCVFFFSFIFNRFDFLEHF